MKKYEKPAVLVERFSLSETLASCNTYRVNFKSDQCILDSDCPKEWKELAMNFYFMDGYCVGPQPDEGAVCYITSANMAFTS